VRFWDTSALVPLFADEATTPAVRDILSLDDKVVVWSLTRVELTSAMWRRDPPPKTGRAMAVAEVTRAWSDWSEVSEFETVSNRSLSLCERHRLRAADALQLAAALLASEGVPSSLPFVTLDTDLASAARAEGFPVLP
jgi:predicted nucleic acid-binding protein